jgi:hypothetical protein
MQVLPTFLFVAGGFMLAQLGTEYEASFCQEGMHRYCVTLQAQQDIQDAWPATDQKHHLTHQQVNGDNKQNKPPHTPASKHWRSTAYW